MKTQLLCGDRLANDLSRICVATGCVEKSGNAAHIGLDSSPWRTRNMACHLPATPQIGRIDTGIPFTIPHAPY